MLIIKPKQVHINLCKLVNIDCMVCNTKTEVDLTMLITIKLFTLSNNLHGAPLSYPVTLGPPH